MRSTLVRLALATAVAGTTACGGGGDSGDGGITTPPAAQTGTISGTVTSAGAGVPGATVTLGSTSQTSNSSGQFTFSNVSAGSHTVTLTVPADYELDSGQSAARSVSVAAGQTATVGWTLRRTGALPTSAEVTMEASSFSPSTVTIATGGTVRWVNAAAIAHTVTPGNTSQAGVWASQNIPAQTGASFSHTFGTAGTFEYSCQLHSGMTGTVRVQ